MSHGFEGDEQSDAIARILGITAEQVEQYVTIDTNESDEGMLYSYIATFDESTPLEVRQAAGAGDGYSLDLGPNVFDEEE